jgi:hypothetical protein
MSLPYRKPTKYVLFLLIAVLSLGLTMPVLAQVPPATALCAVMEEFCVQEPDPGTLSVSLTASTTNGTSQLSGVVLTARSGITGTGLGASDTINYTFYCHREDGDEATVESSSAPTPANLGGEKWDNVRDLVKSTNPDKPEDGSRYFGSAGRCEYVSKGDVDVVYTARVIAEWKSQRVQQSVKITVKPGQFDVTLSVDPDVKKLELGQTVTPSNYTAKILNFKGEPGSKFVYTFSCPETGQSYVSQETAEKEYSISDGDLNCYYDAATKSKISADAYHPTVDVQLIGETVHNGDDYTILSGRAAVNNNDGRHAIYGATPVYDGEGHSVQTATVGAFTYIYSTRDGYTVKDQLGRTVEWGYCVPGDNCTDGKGIHTVRKVYFPEEFTCPTEGAGRISCAPDAVVVTSADRYETWGDAHYVRNIQSDSFEIVTPLNSVHQVTYTWMAVRGSIPGKLYAGNANSSSFLDENDRVYQKHPFYGYFSRPVDLPSGGKLQGDPSQFSAVVSRSSSISESPVCGWDHQSTPSPKVLTVETSRFVWTDPCNVGVNTRGDTSINWIVMSGDITPRNFSQPVIQSGFTLQEPDSDRNGYNLVTYPKTFKRSSTSIQLAQNWWMWGSSELQIVGSNTSSFKIRGDAFLRECMAIVKSLPFGRNDFDPLKVNQKGFVSKEDCKTEILRYRGGRPPQLEWFWDVIRLGNYWIVSDTAKVSSRGESATPQTATASADFYAQPALNISLKINNSTDDAQLLEATASSGVTPKMSIEVGGSAGELGGTTNYYLFCNKQGKDDLTDVQKDGLIEGPDPVDANKNVDGPFTGHKSINADNASPYVDVKATM